MFVTSFDFGFESSNLLVQFGDLLASETVLLNQILRDLLMLVRFVSGRLELSDKLAVVLNLDLQLFFNFFLLVLHLV